ncbi:hypothetical protein GCM10011316_08170 [Roseibium aquae]|uniref:Phytase-like domain-containing protein n=1 Tax=Roseibium aquae TaxID=1323746 RepID=A0A916TBE3_9HYPH|nr:esterase-like activity of phytase family protein [Roseibium aquae]GGB38478.1 hypothetical protein GCM10011316_08170 [Roseibium aquae]
MRLIAARAIRGACRVLFLVPLLLACTLPVPSTALDLLREGKPAAVRTKPIETFEIGRETSRFGMLTFLGGLEILSSDRDIGGLSALLSLDRGNTLFALTDNGRWVTAELDQAPDGTPLGITSLRHAEILGLDGKGLRADWRHDTEAMTLDGRGALYVSAERANAIYRFAWPLVTGKERMLDEVEVPPEIHQLRASKGLEALAMGPPDTPLAGTLVAIAERGMSDSHDLPAFLISGSSARTFTIARSGRYDATDAVFLPNGDLLLLERRFNLRDLVGMRLRQFSSAEIVPGARLEGTVLLEAGYTFQIDNMEAIAVHQTAAGDTILTLLSDNNRSLLQRTIFLRFKLDAGSEP